MSDLIALTDLTVAPYILKATALIRVSRKVGGNQFRHSMATFAILLDYKYYDDSVLLKASILHDIAEDIGYEELYEIYNIDSDGPEVIKLVLEVSRLNNETKEQYLQRVQNSSKRAKILKCADRISNLTDLHLDTHTSGKIYDYLLQTEKYILPLAKEVNVDFVKEINDLIKKRKKLC